MNNLTFGLEVMVIGFVVVMVTLYLLYLILVGFSRCCVRPVRSKPVNGSNSTMPPAVLQEAGAAPVAAAVSQQAFGTAPEIVAAITAAISACLNTPANQFEIVSVQTVQPAHSTANGSDWTVAGRKRLMEKRQDLAMFRRERK